ncbi:ABC transporter substrate-binding protein, partial [Pseudomonas sp. URIL14HWK12:I6]
MWALDNPDGRHKVTQSFIDEWNAENPDIQVKFEAIPADQYMGEKLSAAMMSGTGPDIFFLSRGDFLKFVESGLVHPLDEWFTEERRQDFLPLVLEAVTYQGKIMTYPMEMDPVALFYDKQVFAENNLQPPQTWDELVDIAVKLTTKDRYGIYLAP